MPDKKEMQPSEDREVALLSTALHNDIRKLIDQAKGHVAREYNSTQVLLNWMIGRRICHFQKTMTMKAPRLSEILSIDKDFWGLKSLSMDSKLPELLVNG